MQHFYSATTMFIIDNNKISKCFFFTVVNIFVNFFSKTLQGNQSYHKSCNSGNS